MLRAYVLHVAKQLRNYSLTLDQSNILVDKPWALIDEEKEMQKLIFKSNKELIMSKNGQVQIGKWDYFPEAKSLLIDRIKDKILCNEAFIDNGAMILKLDGTQNQFFIFANESIIPDLDVASYLKTLRNHRLFIVEMKIEGGKILEIETQYEDAPPLIGNKVSIDAEPANDGLVKIVNENNYFEIKDGRIFKIITECSYLNPSRFVITIHQQGQWGPTPGDRVFVNGNIPSDQTIALTKSKNLIISEGRFVRIERKSLVARFLSQLWQSFIS